MLQSVETEQWYRNIKTQKVYRVIAIATHSETEEKLVVYRSMASPTLETWVRPIDLFKEKFQDI